MQSTVDGFFFSVYVSFHICNAVLVGEDQVSAGIVALDSQQQSSQSAKSVFLLAIATRN